MTIEWAGYQFDSDSIDDAQLVESADGVAWRVPCLPNPATDYIETTDDGLRQIRQAVADASN